MGPILALAEEMCRGACRLGSDEDIRILLTFGGIAASIITGFSLRGRHEHTHAELLAPFVGAVFWSGVAILTLALPLPQSCWVRHRAVMCAYLQILAGCLATLALAAWTLPGVFEAAVRLRSHTGPRLLSPIGRAAARIRRLRS